MASSRQVGPVRSCSRCRRALFAGSACFIILLVCSYLLQSTLAPWRLGDTPPVQVAVCFFGLTRSLQFTIDSIRTNVLDVLTAAGVQYTTYLHTHNVTRMFNPRAFEFNVTVDPTLYRLLRPDAAVFEEPIDWTQPSNQDLLAALLTRGDPWGWRGDHISIRNLVNQLHSLQAVTALWAPHASRFDAVIYLRSDVWFFNRLDVPQLLEAAASTSHPTIWTPAFGTHSGLNDRFAFGNVAAMRIYGNRWQGAEDYALTANLHAERFLKHAMAAAGVECRTTGIVFTRVRADGLVMELPVVDASQRVNTTHIRGSTAHRMVRSSFGNWQLQPAAAPAARAAARRAAVQACAKSCARVVTELLAEVRANKCANASADAPAGRAAQALSGAALDGGR